jgi:membrane peptidoglycan carboxypeptidase
LTALTPAVGDDTSPDLRDPIEAVKTALDAGPRSDDRPLSEPPPRSEQQRRGRDDARPREKPPPRDADILARLHRRLSRLNWRWIRRGAYIAAVVLLMLPPVTFAMAYFTVDIPQPGDIHTNQVSTILASDGTELAKIVPPEGNRVDIKLAQVPMHVRNAVLAAEDRDFYSNSGFSFTGFARAVKNNVVRGDRQGGSTITQQYVKNALVGSQRAGVGGLVRKAKELVIATKMSRAWTKDEVLEAYLNIIYFGRGAYGIAAASQAYFDKPVEQLNIAQGALLAALIQRPSSLDPAVDREGAITRWNWVLDGMVDIGALSESDRAKQEFPVTVPPEHARAENQTTGPNGLIERQVTHELTDLLDIDEQTLNTKGLQITTTIDTRAQRAAENAVAKYLDEQDSDMRAAVVSINPRSGAV